MSRTIRQRLLAGVGVAIALASLPLLALADTEINARGWSHDAMAGWCSIARRG